MAPERVVQATSAAETLGDTWRLREDPLGEIPVVVRLQQHEIEEDGFLGAMVMQVDPLVGPIGQATHN